MLFSEEIRMLYMAQAGYQPSNIIARAVSFEELTLGTGIALVLNKKFIGRGFVRAIILIPWAVPTVVNARLWEWIYAGSSFGALNGLLKVLGVLAKDKNIVWLGFDIPFAGVPVLSSFFSWMGVSRALNMIILADTWKVTPLVIFLLLAGLQQIPASLYEVASIDGANSWRKFWSVTYPFLKPVFLVILVLRTMELFRVFGIIYILMQYSIRVVGIYTYETGMKFLRFGKGSALSAGTYLPEIYHFRLNYGQCKGLEKNR